jgi:hypothetical protein
MNDSKQVALVAVEPETTPKHIAIDIVNDGLDRLRRNGWNIEWTAPPERDAWTVRVWKGGAMRYAEGYTLTEAIQGVVESIGT